PPPTVSSIGGAPGAALTSRPSAGPPTGARLSSPSTSDAAGAGSATTVCSEPGARSTATVRAPSAAGPFGPSATVCGPLGTIRYPVSRPKPSAAAGRPSTITSSVAVSGP